MITILHVLSQIHTLIVDNLHNWTFLDKFTNINTLTETANRDNLEEISHYTASCLFFLNKLIASRIIPNNYCGWSVYINDPHKLELR